MAKNKKNNRVAWSEDEVKLLKRLFPLGRAREVAEQTGPVLIREYPIRKVGF